MTRGDWVETFIFYSPRIVLSQSEHDILGPLDRATATSTSPTDILDGLYQCVSAQLQGDLRSHNTAVLTRALCALTKAYEVLCRSGYAEFLELHEQLAVGLRRIAVTQRKVLTRKLLSPATSDEEAERISQFLVDMMSPSRGNGRCSPTQN